MKHFTSIRTVNDHDLTAMKLGESLTAVATNLGTVYARLEFFTRTHKNLKTQWRVEKDGRGIVAVRRVR